MSNTAVMRIRWYSYKRFIKQSCFSIVIVIDAKPKFETFYLYTFHEKDIVRF